MSSLVFPACAITLLFLYVSPAIADVIVDAQGELLQNGGAYHILPYKGGSGGLTVTKGNDSSPCPLYTKPETGTLGLPITISTPPKIAFLSTHNTIEFSFDSISSPCNRQLRWYVMKPKDVDERAHVVVGVSKEFKNKYFFKIKKAKFGEIVYNIKFCTVVTNKFFTALSMEDLCLNVGILPDGLLGITMPPNFPVYFAKASVGPLNKSS